MAVAIHTFHREHPMEERVARLEAHYEHLRSDLQRIEDKLDKVESKIGARSDKADARMDQLDAKLEVLAKFVHEFRLEMKGTLAKIAESRLADRVWQLLINAALLGVMARGFKWI